MAHVPLRLPGRLGTALEFVLTGTVILKLVCGGRISRRGSLIQIFGLYPDTEAQDLACLRALLFTQLSEGF